MEHVKRLVLMPEHMAENTTQSKPLVLPLTSQVNQLETQPEPVDLPNNIETSILESVPPTMKTRARQLVKKLKENKNLITWDDKAQLVCEGKPIPGSNVVDLVNDALRHRKNFNPHGWRLFCKSIE